jgi:hypothetical protein
MTVVTGVAIPTDWDDKGNVVGIAIYSHDETEYFVDKKGKGPELLPLIRKVVEVSGVVREEENRKIITVRKFNVAENPAPGGILPG